jgi:alanyl-tRNA synthetase
VYDICETRVTYHHGHLEGYGRVLAVLPYGSVGDSRRVVVTDSTPFHPLDRFWPDQPADHGVISLGSMALSVVDTQVLSVESATGEVRIGPEVSARRGSAGHVLAVAHVVDAADADVAGWVGQVVSLEVDAARRLALSAAHTGCHLVAFAFNQCVDGLWTKDAPRDSRGNRNFDAAALLQTRHHIGGSVDRYRLGRSLRKKGFNHPELIAGLDAHILRANEMLALWLASKAEVTVAGGSDYFTAERLWRCAIAPPAVMPCGGTHVFHLGKIAQIDISAQFDDEMQELTLAASTRLR